MRGCLHPFCSGVVPVPHSHHIRRCLTLHCPQHLSPGRASSERSLICHLSQTGNPPIFHLTCPVISPDAHPHPHTHAHAYAHSLSLGKSLAAVEPPPLPGRCVSLLRVGASSECAQAAQIAAAPAPKHPVSPGCLACLVLLCCCCNTRPPILNVSQVGGPAARHSWATCTGWRPGTVENGP